MKIRPVVAKLYHADVQTDENDEADSRFLQFCARTPKWLLFSRRTAAVSLVICRMLLFVTSEQYCVSSHDSKLSDTE
jgi:hypothetical protein